MWIIIAVMALLLMCLALLILLLQKTTKVWEHVHGSKATETLSGLGQRILDLIAGTSSLETRIHATTVDVTQELSSFKQSVEEHGASQTRLLETIAAVSHTNSKLLAATTDQLGNTLHQLDHTATALKTSAQALSETLPDKMSEIETLLSKLSNVVQQEFEKQVVRNRSWLASPYPKRLKASSADPTWERIRQGVRLLGVHLKSPLSVQLVCEECGQTSKDDPYTLDGVRIEFEDEAVKFYLHAGIAIGVIVLGDHLPPLDFVIHDHELYAKLAHLLGRVKLAAELGKHLSPELLAKALFERFKAGDNKAVSEAEIDTKAKNLFESLGDSTLTAINLGGNAHLHLGKLIEHQDMVDLISRRPYGGLVRVLSKDDKIYKWVCDECWARNYVPAEPPSI